LTKKQAAAHAAKMEVIAKEIKQFLVDRDMWLDTRIYFNGMAFCSCGGVDTVLTDIKPETFFKYTNPETLSMSFEGPLYEELNYGTYGWKTQTEFIELLEKHGYYYELGNYWNLSLQEN
jgi:hypothetical protein